MISKDWHGSCDIPSMGKAQDCRLGTWHEACNVSGMANEGKGRVADWHGACYDSGVERRQNKDETKTKKTMTDLKEIAWEEYGREAYEESMRLRFMMDTWPEDEEEQTNEKSQKEGA